MQDALVVESIVWGPLRSLGIAACPSWLRQRTLPTRKKLLAVETRMSGENREAGPQRQGKTAVRSESRWAQNPKGMAEQGEDLFPPSHNLPQLQFRALARRKGKRPKGEDERQKPRILSGMIHWIRRTRYLLRYRARNSVFHALKENLPATQSRKSAGLCQSFTNYVFLHDFLQLGICFSSWNGT